MAVPRNRTSNARKNSPERNTTCQKTTSHQPLRQLRSDETPTHYLQFLRAL